MAFSPEPRDLRALKENDLPNVGMSLQKIGAPVLHDPVDRDIGPRLGKGCDRGKCKDDIADAAEENDEDRASFRKAGSAGERGGPRSGGSWERFGEEGGQTGISRG
jgi:hypothetical protein